MQMGAVFLIFPSNKAYYIKETDYCLLREMNTPPREITQIYKNSLPFHRRLLLRKEFKEQIQICS